MMPSLSKWTSLASVAGRCGLEGQRNWAICARAVGGFRTGQRAGRCHRSRVACARLRFPGGGRIPVGGLSQTALALGLCERENWCSRADRLCRASACKLLPRVAREMGVRLPVAKGLKPHACPASNFPESSVSCSLRQISALSLKPTPAPHTRRSRRRIPAPPERNLGGGSFCLTRAVWKGGPVQPSPNPLKESVRTQVGKPAGPQVELEWELTG